MSIMVFTSFQIGKEIYISNWGVLVTMNAGLFLFSLLYLMSFRQRHKNVCWIQLLYGLTLIVSFAFYWTHLGGIDGMASYFVFAVMIFFIVQLPSQFKLGFVVLSVLVVLSLAYYFPQGICEQSAVYRQTQMIDFLLCCGLFAIVVLYLKNGFDLNRKAILRRNRRLDSLKMQLEEKKKALTHRKHELIAMSSYLEQMIVERTEELDFENRSLEQYAYDNAHFLRGPLCNIKGVIALMKKEEGVNEVINTLSAKVDVLDEQIFKVNNILK